MLYLLLNNFLHRERVTQLRYVNLLILPVLNDGPPLVLVIVRDVLPGFVRPIHLDARIGVHCVVLLEATQLAILRVLIHAPSKNPLNVKIKTGIGFFIRSLALLQELPVIFAIEDFL